MLHIFIFEPDMDRANQIDDLLVENGYDVSTFDTSMDMLAQLKMEIPSLLLLRRNLSDGTDGADICRIIRDDKRLRCVPIILISPGITDDDEAYVLEMGADSVLDEPYSDKLLLGRIRSAMRRVAVLDELYDVQEFIQIKDISIDSNKHEVYKDGQLIKMTYKEFELLYTLAKYKSQVLTRETLLYKVWGYTYAGETRTVDVHIRSIRKLLGDAQKTYIETVRGLGYKMGDD